MTFKEFMARCRRSNPKLFAADEIKMRPSSLEAILRIAYDEGRQAGLANASTVYEKLRAFEFGWGKL